MCDATPLRIQDRHVRCKWPHVVLPRASPKVNASSDTLANAVGGLRGINKLAQAARRAIKKSADLVKSGSY